MATWQICFSGTEGNNAQEADLLVVCALTTMFIKGSISQRNQNLLGQRLDIHRHWL